ncbi:MAG: hypothetical protein JWN52_7968 [Actinomycetia bacterium]|nr:hypothetical protein [Actinomycetes bacterium]
MVVSFMIAVPLPWCRPLWAASPLLRTPPPRSDTPLPDYFEEFSGTPVVIDPTARQCRGDCAPPPQCPVRTSSWTRSIAKILTSGGGRRTARARGQPRRWRSRRSAGCGRQAEHGIGFDGDAVVDEFGGVGVAELVDVDLDTGLRDGFRGDLEDQFAGTVVAVSRHDDAHAHLASRPLDVRDFDLVCVPMFSLLFQRAISVLPLKARSQSMTTPSSEKALRKVSLSSRSSRRSSSEWVFRGRNIASLSCGGRCAVRYGRRLSLPCSPRFVASIIVCVGVSRSSIRSLFCGGQRRVRRSTSRCPCPEVGSRRTGRRPPHRRVRPPRCAPAHRGSASAMPRQVTR